MSRNSNKKLKNKKSKYVKIDLAPYLPPKNWNAITQNIMNDKELNKFLDQHLFMIKLIKLQTLILTTNYFLEKGYIVNIGIHPVSKRYFQLTPPSFDVSTWSKKYMDFLLETVLSVGTFIEKMNITRLLDLLYLREEKLEPENNDIETKYSYEYYGLTEQDKKNDYAKLESSIDYILKNL